MYLNLIKNKYIIILRRITIKISEITCRQAIVKSNLPESDFVINPYIGCTHGCIYCYARFMKRFSNHEENWGDFIDVKINSPSTIPFAGSRYEQKRVFLSSVTDPYLSLEKKYKLTRSILERLVPLSPDLSVQSKSVLLKRDIDVFQNFDKCTVGMTITSSYDGLRKEIEPYASPVEERIETIKSFKKHGIDTHIFIGPVIPFFTDWKAILEKTAKYTNFYYIENLNTRGSIKKDMLHWIRNNHKDKYEDFIYFLNNPDSWDEIEEEIKHYTNSNGIEARICFHHGKR